MNYAIVLAAGKGSRMKNSIPKCGMSILGKPMVRYLVDSIKNTSIDEILCVVGYKKEFFYPILDGLVTFKTQEYPLGSGNAVLSCKGIDTDGFCLIVNGDTPLIDSSIIEEMIHMHQSQKNDVTIAVAHLDNPSGYGRIIRSENKRILGIVEDVDLSLEQRDICEVNTGVMIVRTNLLFKALEQIDCYNNKNEYYLTDIIKYLNDYKICSYIVKDSFRFMGANSLEELSRLEEYMRLDILQHHLEHGIKIEGLNTTTIGPDVIIEPDCIIKDSTIMGKSVIHKGCRIGFSEINDSTIFDDSMVTHSVVEDSIVGINCSVGPYAHIRFNSVISGNNRIGNFVEVKNSKVGIGSKLSHLGYMGDTLCGKNVNFGCGSITVNYDGKQKHRTTIEDDAFIGCNCNLIAPIHIEKKGYIAAGSTITDPLGQGDFAIARSTQITKKGYASKYDKKE